MQTGRESTKVYVDFLGFTAAIRTAGYAVRGVEIEYFDTNLAGRLIVGVFRFLLGSRLRVRPANYQAGDIKGLTADSTRVAIELTECWFESASSPPITNILSDSCGTVWPLAFAKKSVMLSARRRLIRQGVVNDDAGRSRGEVIYFHRNSWLAKQCVAYDAANNEINYRARSYPVVPPRLFLIAFALRYSVSLVAFLARRGIALRHTTTDHVIGKRAMMPVGAPRGDDALVDGNLIKPDDMLIFHSARKRKLHVALAVEAARIAGYETVDLSRVRPYLGWLFRPATVLYYWLSPLAKTMRTAILLDSSACIVMTLMLRLRRATMAWDVFFERHQLTAIQESGFFEEQVAATISADRHRVMSFSLQGSELFDPLNEDHRYLVHHCHFVWGRGLKDMWQPLWAYDEVIVSGYLWGQLQRRYSESRDSIRSRFGASEGRPLVSVFDTSVSKNSFNSPNNLRRFYRVLPELAQECSDAIFVVKPKDMGIRPLFDKEVTNQQGADRLIWEDVLEISANELIVASDLVISMSHSSTFIEALLCGIPSVTFDTTGRDWDDPVAVSSALVADNERDLCALVTGILAQGIDPFTWAKIQDRVRWNYGEVDGHELDRVRMRILSIALDDLDSTSDVREPEMVAHAK